MYMENYIKNLVFILVMGFTCIVNGRTMIHVGVILDIESSTGKMINTCISMAIDDFYQQHENYTTMIQPHFRDSKDNVEAAFAAIDLLKKVPVMAILGPMKSSQADFVIDIGNKSKVPVISPATSPSLSPNVNLYFVRSSHNSSSQLEPLAEMIKRFGWREVGFVYEDDEYGRGLVPYFSDSMSTIDAKVMSRTVIHSSASDDWILEKLYKLKTMQTRVFVVHTLLDLASPFFKKVKEAGMMEEGYVWIITDGLTSRLHSLDRADIYSMQGVVGVKSYIPRSKEYINFEQRWKREVRKRNLEDVVAELDMSGIWSYDTVFALALTLEKVISNEITTTFKRQRKSSKDLDAIRTTEMRSSLLQRIRNFKFKGLSGNFHVLDGQLQSSVYEIVNIIGKSEKTIGYWTPKNGISKKLKLSTNNQTNDLGAIIWPGDRHIAPKGWELPTSNENKLRVGVPVKTGFFEFINVNTNPQTQQLEVTGFCVDVFNAVIGALPYAVKHEFIPFATADGKEAGNYNDLIHNLSVGKYDAVAGDVTILANRADYVDFTLPYTEAGVSILVPIKDERKSAWIFMRPLEKKLWITIGGFFLYTGIVVWILERRVNKEFRGPPSQQVGMIFWYSFSTIVFAHREKLISNFSRFVVIVWVFVVLVLTSSYTASLTSMLTVQQLQPKYTNINQILRNGESVGYQDGSFVKDMLIKIGFDHNKVKNYSTFEQYDKALQLGSRNGGVSAIMDELPYFRVFLAKYCTKYTMTGPTYKTAGLGFAFPKGSPLVHDISRAVLQVTEEQITNISKQWFGESASCDQQNGAKVTSDTLTLESFTGLFLIAGLSSTSAFVLFFLTFLYQNKEMLVSQIPIRQKLDAIAKTFVSSKDEETKKTTIEAAGDDFISEADINNNSALNALHQEAEAPSHEEGFSPPEPTTPVNEPIQVTETAMET